MDAGYMVCKAYRDLATRSEMGDRWREGGGMVMSLLGWAITSIHAWKKGWMDGWVNEWVDGTQRNNQITAITDITVMKFIFRSTFLFFLFLDMVMCVILRWIDMCMYV